jgi:cytochrome c oxidase cbb3-type subunit 3
MNRRSRGATRLLAAVACTTLLVVSVQCKREERNFYTTSQPAEAQTVGLVQMSTLEPGTTQPVMAVINSPIQEYEGSSYQMSEGQRLFSAYNCSGCHANGGGGIGPPLMDDKWIYGHEPADIYATIVQGRPNGMPAFGKKLPTEQIWQLTAYVRSISGLTAFTVAPSRSDKIKSTPSPSSKNPEKPVESGASKSAARPS